MIISPLPVVPSSPWRPCVPRGPSPTISMPFCVICFLSSRRSPRIRWLLRGWGFWHFIGSCTRHCFGWSCSSRRARFWFPTSCITSSSPSRLLRCLPGRDHQSLPLQYQSLLGHSLWELSRTDCCNPGAPKVSKPSLGPRSSRKSSNLPACLEPSIDGERDERLVNVDKGDSWNLSTRLFMSPK